MGEVTVIVGITGWAMVKTALLRSVMVAFEASVILTRHCDEGVFGTVHEYVPADALTLADIPVHEEPLLAEYSSLTFVKFWLVQVMFCVEKAGQASEPLGAVTVMVLAPGISGAKA